MADTPKILIATPAYKEGAEMQYAVSLFDLGQELFRLGIPSYIRSVALPDIGTARDYLACRALYDERVTHLLFIDADMSFKPSAVIKMLKANKRFIGCAYPGRLPSPDALMDAARKHSSNQDAMAAALRFNFVPKPGPRAAVEECELVGGGLMLIERQVLSGLAASPAVRKGPVPAALPKLPGPLYGFCDRIVLPDGGRLGEDYSLCHRWKTLCGGSIHVVTDEIVGHVGMVRFEGSIPKPIS